MWFYTVNKFNIFIIFTICYSSLQNTLESKNVIFGTKREPANVTCGSAPSSVKDGNYYMGPPSKPFKVYCNMKSKETCLDKEEGTQKTSDIYYTGEQTDLPNRFVVKGPFWLSDLGVTLKEIYQLSDEQITWLQQHSTAARQVIRYRCFNSTPYSITNTSMSIQLRSWNNIVFGPQPSKFSSEHYSIPLESHRCLGNPRVANTDIVIQSINAYSLPITDIQVRDIHDEIQAFFIQNVEICFK